MGAVLGAAAAGAMYARHLDRKRARDGSLARKGFVRVERVTTINRPVDEVYAFWKRFENFPRFMRHIESVETLPGGRARGGAPGPAGPPVEWGAELVAARPGGWRAGRRCAGGGVAHSGAA